MITLPGGLLPGPPELWCASPGARPGPLLGGEPAQRGPSRPPGRPPNTSFVRNGASCSLRGACRRRRPPWWLTAGAREICFPRAAFRWKRREGERASSASSAGGGVVGSRKETKGSISATFDHPPHVRAARQKSPSRPEAVVMVVMNRFRAPYWGPFEAGDRRRSDGRRQASRPVMASATTLCCSNCPRTRRAPPSVSTHWPLVTGGATRIHGSAQQNPPTRTVDRFESSNPLDRLPSFLTSWPSPPVALLSNFTRP